MTHHQVIIIGAGIAGCSAAKTLIESGINDILILEACGRVGGRIKTITTGDSGAYRLEMGAQWIHGDINNPLYDLLSTKGILEYKGEHLYDDEFADTMEFRDASGSKISSADMFEGFHMHSMLGDRIFSMWDPELMSIDQFKKEQFDLICLERGVTEEQKPYFKQLVSWANKSRMSSEGLDFSDGSEYKNDDKYDDCGGKNYVFTRGTISIINEVFLPVINEKVKLNTEVTKIVITGEKGMTLIHTNDINGSAIYSADHVIVTPSIGFLKEHHQNLFRPMLPADKIAALEKLTFGTVEKFCFHFERPFWSEELAKDPYFAGYGFVYDENSPDMEKLSLQVTSLIGREASWWKEIASLTTVKTNPNILIVWLAGKAAHEANQYDDDTVREVVLTLLNFFTGITPNEQPKLIRSTWGQDKYFLGSYTAVASSYTCDVSPTMMEPIYYSDKPAVMFAGEAYHDRLMSSMPGAYETGRKQALTIKEYHENHKQY